MPYDALMRPAPTLAGVGATVNAALIGGGASGAISPAVVVDFGGANAEVESHLRIGGAVSGAGTPSLTLKYQESADGSTGWTDIISHTAQTATMAETNSGGARVLSVDPSRATFRTTKRYVRAFITLAASTDVFANVMAALIPTMGARPTSGKS